MLTGWLAQRSQSSAYMHSRMWGLALSLLVGCHAEHERDPDSGADCDETRGLLTCTFDWEIVWVVEPALMPRVKARIESFMSAILTGDRDRDGVQDHVANPALTVAVATPEEALATALHLKCLARNGVDCQPTTLPAVSYHYYPYGYAIPDAAFEAKLDCLFTRHAGASCDEQLDSLTLEESGTFVVVNDRDLCDMPGPDCVNDPQVALQDALQWNSSGPHNVIAPMPPGLLSDDAIVSTDNGPDYSRYVQRVLDDPRVADPSARFACDGAPASAATRWFERTLGDRRRTRPTFASLCDSDYLPLLKAWGPMRCTGIQWGSLLDIEALARNTDGTPRCVLEERLPQSGPIQHCAQLSAFGRTAAGTTIDGAELCHIQQLPLVTYPAPATDAYGYRLVDGLDPDAGKARMVSAPEYGKRGGYSEACAMGTESRLHFELTPNTLLVPGTLLELHCQRAQGCAR